MMLRSTESKTISPTDKRKKNSLLGSALVVCLLSAMNAWTGSGCGPVVTLPDGGPPPDADPPPDAEPPPLACDPTRYIGVPLDRKELGECAENGPSPQAQPLPNMMFEEFVGPFTSWKDVKVDFHAAGDGMTDDTNAIQEAIDDFCDMPNSMSAVLYFPAGTYVITSTLENVTPPANCQRNYKGFTMIGEDPANTIIQWNGPCKGTMMHLDMPYGKVSRLSFHGHGQFGNAGVGIYRGHSFSTASELSDLWFQDLNIGVQMGLPNPENCSQFGGQAEQALFRCRFTNCSESGVYVPNSNTLDIWVWRSQFEGCQYGVHSDKGNFHVYDSVFKGSKEADIYAANLGTFAFVNNVSIGSKTFLRQNNHSQGARTLVQGNRIFDWSGEFGLVTATTGSFLILDNTFRPTDPNAPAVQLTAANQVLVGNTYTSANAVTMMPNPNYDPMRQREIEPHVVLPPMVIPDPVIIPPQAPPLRVRARFEPNTTILNDADAIQGAINLAAAEPPNTRPVVHIPKRKWSLDKPLIIPAMVDMQIIGDGVENGTILNGELIATGEAAVRVLGPSHAVLRDFEVIGRDDSQGVLSRGGILIEGVDQPGGRIYGEQVNVRRIDPQTAVPETGIFINGVEEADVTFLASAFSAANTGIKVSGGPKRAAGSSPPPEGVAAFISGASGGTGKLYDVIDGGMLLAEAVWYEGKWNGAEIIADVQTPLNAPNTPGSLTLAAMHFAVPTETIRPVLKSTNYRGDIAVLVSFFAQQAPLPPAHFMEFTGNSNTLRTLMMGDTFAVTARKPDMSLVDVNWIWNDTTAPSAAALYHPQLHSSDPALLGSTKVAVNIPNVTNKVQDQEPSISHILELLKPLRDSNKRIEAYHDAPHGASDVTSIGLFRVFATGGTGRNHLEIRR